MMIYKYKALKSGPIPLEGVLNVYEDTVFAVSDNLTPLFDILVDMGYLKKNTTGPSKVVKEPSLHPGRPRDKDRG